MAGIGDNAAAMGDWMPPSPGHKNFFSNLMVDEFDPKSFLKYEGQEAVCSKEEECHAALQFPADISSSKPSSVNAHKPSLTERRAARAGFSAPKIDTNQFRAADFSSLNSDVRSPYLTIPPGLSPTTLLDSPVFVSNSLVWFTS